MNLWKKFTELTITKKLKLSSGAVMDVNGTEVDLTELAALNSIGAADLAKIDGITNGTQAAGKAVVADANVNTGISKVTQLHIGASGSETQVTATATELNESFLHLDIADGSADATYYVVSPHAGNITKIWTVIDGAVSTADITVTANIGATPVTNGAVTIATAASAAGDVDSATPTAANTVTAGQAINFVVAGGGAGGSPRIHLVAVVTRT